MGSAIRDVERDEEQCRICASDIAVYGGVHIFAEEGRRHYLQTHIRKYLYILVSSEDKLSKMVCTACIKRLESINRFAIMALRTQEKLKVNLHTVEDNVDSTQFIDDKETRDVQRVKKKYDDRGFLHSILTKGAIDDCIESSEEPGKKEKYSSNMEEMEVKVDPMLFLEYGLDQTSSDFSDVSDDEEKLAETTSFPFRSSSEDEAHKCTICADAFVLQADLQDHLWSHLPKDKTLDEKSVFRSQEMDSSSGVSQTGDNASENFVCPICSKKISTKGNLKVHLETHRPKGKYGCDICGRIFKTQSNLYRHKEYHGGIQYPCNVCGRVYPTNSTLRAHSITHSNLRPHACPLCDKTFKRNQDLKFHINQHTGARPYQCPYCPKAFASSGNCFSHRKRMHPREVHRDRQRAADLMR